MSSARAQFPVFAQSRMAGGIGSVAANDLLRAYPGKGKESYCGKTLQKVSQARV